MNDIDPYKTPSSQIYEQDNSQLFIHSKYSYIGFVLINTFLILPYEKIFCKGNDYAFILMALLSILIISIQYPFLNRSKKWFQKIMIFYISMVIFLFSFGVIMSFVGNLTQRIGNGFMSLLFGHLFGLPYFVVVVSINYFLKKYLFFQFNY